MRRVFSLFRASEALAPAVVPPSPQPVPSGEALRQALLRASWQRDQQVGRRRLIMRWIGWGIPRFVLPLGLLTAAWAAGHYPEPTHRLLVQAQAIWHWAASNSVSQRTPPSPVPPAVPTLAADGLALRLQTTWPGMDARTATPPSRSVAPDATPHLTLSPDDWLHSKEP